jgi:hypothetical protein
VVIAASGRAPVVADITRISIVLPAEQAAEQASSCLALSNHATAAMFLTIEDLTRVWKRRVNVHPP